MKWLYERENYEIAIFHSINRETCDKIHSLIHYTGTHDYNQFSLSINLYNYLFLILIFFLVGGGGGAFNLFLFDLYPF